MGLFGPGVEKLKAERDFGKLAKALTNRSADVRSQAVAAISELGSA